MLGWDLYLWGDSDSWAVLAPSCYLLGHLGVDPNHSPEDCFPRLLLWEEPSLWMEGECLLSSHLSSLTGSAAKERAKREDGELTAIDIAFPFRNLKGPLAKSTGGNWA